MADPTNGLDRESAEFEEVVAAVGRAFDATRFRRRRPMVGVVGASALTFALAVVAHQWWQNAAEPTAELGSEVLFAEFFEDPSSAQKWSGDERSLVVLDFEDGLPPSQAAWTISRQ